MRPDKRATRLEAALARHKAGDLAAAEPTYRALLRRDPRDAPVLHLLGLLRSQIGAHAEAVPLLRRAVARRPDLGAAWKNLGNALLQLGAAEDALAAFARAIAAEPDLIEARVGRANALAALDRPDEAVATLDALGAEGADHAPSHGARGLAYRRMGRLRDALESFDAALLRDPTCAAAHLNRGLTLSELDRDPEAYVAVATATVLRPDWHSPLVAEGIILRRLGQPAEALASLDRALALSPGDATALATRAACLSDLHRHDEALAAADAAIGEEADRNRGIILHRMGRHAEAEAALAAPEDGAAWNARANVLTELGRFEDALDCLDRAAATHGDNPNIPYNRGNALRGLGRHEDAIAAFGEARRRDPGFAEAEWNESLSRLALGDFAAGLPAYEARWRRRNHPAPRHAAPPWTGQGPAGRTILLHAEQGLGDTIQMARYAPLLAASGARVILEVQRPLLSLLRDLPAIEVIAAGDPVPPHDLQCPLMSLPLAFGTRADTVPPPAPITPDPARVAARAADPASAGFRIGIACSGNPDHAADRHRSVPLAAFAPLLGPGITAVLVQTELRDADAAFLAAEPRIASPCLPDFRDTAALLAGLDAVVCVDTAVAHLAGTLGRPVHLLIPPLPDWRWMLERDNSPWYPTMHLHRRARDESWDAVLARIAALLRPQPAAVSRWSDNGAATSSSDRPSAAKPSLHSVAAAAIISAAPKAYPQAMSVR